MGSLIDKQSAKQNEQELEDELADLLSEDEPNISSKGNHRMPGIIFAVFYIYVNVVNEKCIFQTSQMYRTAVSKMKIWTLIKDYNH